MPNDLRWHTSMNVGPGNEVAESLGRMDGRRNTAQAPDFRAYLAGSAHHQGTSLPSRMFKTKTALRHPQSVDFQNAIPAKSLWNSASARAFCARALPTGIGPIVRSMLGPRVRAAIQS